MKSRNEIRKDAYDEESHVFLGLRRNAKGMVCVPIGWHPCDELDSDDDDDFLFWSAYFLFEEKDDYSSLPNWVFVILLILTVLVVLSLFVR